MHFYQKDVSNPERLQIFTDDYVRCGQLSKLQVYSDCHAF